MAVITVQPAKRPEDLESLAFDLVSPIPVAGPQAVAPFLAAVLGRVGERALRTIPEFAKRFARQTPAGEVVVGRGDEFIGNIPFQNPRQLAFRGAETQLTPRQFFNLTGEPAISSAGGIEEAIRRGEQFANPNLFLRPTDEGLRVVSEEGRNRMIALGKILNVDTPVPTNLLFQGQRRAEDFVTDPLVREQLEAGFLLPREGAQGIPIRMRQDVLLSEENPRIRALIRELGLGE